MGSCALQFLLSLWDLRKTPLGYLPIAVGAFEFPAKALAGPLLVDILVGSLLSGVDEAFELTGDGIAEVLGVGSLENGRCACTGCD